MEALKENKKESVSLSVYIAGAAGVILSAALPFGTGLLVLALLIAVAGALVGITLGGMRAIADSMGGIATFGWAPTAAYLAGKKGKGRKA